MNSAENKIFLCKDSVDPDPELLLWEKWIKIRKEETKHLAQKTGRAPVDLAMNLLENVRQDKERKTVLEHSQVDKKVSLRNTVWEQPQRLKQKCYCDPVYEVQRTCADIGRPRIIEHIGVPQRIQETEKGKTGVPKRKPCVKLDSSYVAYREKREKELEINIRKIDPFRPDIEKLMVIGSTPKPPQIKMPPLPNITISCIIENVQDMCSIYAIRINDTILLNDIKSLKARYLIKMQNESWHEACNSWSYYFNCPINKVGRSKFSLQNLGTVTLRYCWKKIKLPYEDIEDGVFFFNKNENVIYPGQKQNISVTFISNIPGSFSESWEIIFLNAYFFDTENKHLIFNLHADSVENTAKIKRKINKLENIIYNKVLKNIATNLLEEIIVKATSVEPQIYPYRKMFLEAEMFVMKNPVCYYHQTEVMKLKETFTEMTPKEVWDLSVSTWRSIMINKEFDDRMRYYDQLKKSHRECLKPWHEDNDLLVQKYSAVKQLLGQLADKFDEEFITILKMLNLDENNEERERSKQSQYEVISNTFLSPVISNIFYIKVYEHVGSAMESCAGVLSSLDLNRWINFDFCRS